MPSLTSGGKPIRLDAHFPSTPGPHPAILLLHGSGGNSGFWLERLAPAVARMGVALFAVHYFDRTGTTRASPADLQDGVHVPLWLETVRDTLSHIGSLPAATPAQQVDPARIALVGVSLGAFLSLALAAGPDTDRPAPPTSPIRAIVEISGGLVPPYAGRATSAFPPTLIVHGDSDTVVPVSLAHSLRDLLTRLGVKHEQLLLPGEGHWFSSAAQLRILGAVASFLGSNL